jgi:hypothetical protein
MSQTECLSLHCVAWGQEMGEPIGKGSECGSFSGESRGSRNVEVKISAQVGCIGNLKRTYKGSNSTYPCVEKEMGDLLLSHTNSCQTK